MLTITLTEAVGAIVPPRSTDARLSPSYVSASAAARKVFIFRFVPAFELPLRPSISQLQRLSEDYVILRYDPIRDRDGEFKRFTPLAY